MNDRTGVAGKLQSLNAMNRHDFRHALRTNRRNGNATTGPNPQGTLFLNRREILHIVAHFAVQPGQTGLQTLRLARFIVQVQTNETPVGRVAELLKQRRLDAVCGTVVHRRVRNVVDYGHGQPDFFQGRPDCVVLRVRGAQTVAGVLFVLRRKCYDSELHWEETVVRKWVDFGIGGIAADCTHDSASDDPPVFGEVGQILHDVTHRFGETTSS